MIELLTRLCALERSSAPLPELKDSEAETLSVLAAMQQVAGWLTYRLSTDYTDWAGTQKLLPLLRNSALATVIHNAHLMGVARDICEKLKGFDTVLLKGSALIDSPYYKDISHRYAGDIDIWVEPSRAQGARDILVAAGADKGNYTGPKESIYHSHLPGITYKGMYVELHQRLFDENLKWDLPGKPSDHIIEWHGRRMFNEQAMFHHLVMHAYKHYDATQVTLRWIVDIAILLKNCKEPKELIDFSKSITPDADKAQKWAIGVAIELLPTERTAQLKQMGYEALPFSQNYTKGGQSDSTFKAHAFVRILRGAWIEIKAAHGMKAKLAATKELIRYEIQRTRSRYPGNCLIVALAKRIFIRI